VSVRFKAKAASDKKDAAFYFITKPSILLYSKMVLR